jgi:t-SNARE complex subunit (syntaxin)
MNDRLAELQGGSSWTQDDAASVDIDIEMGHTKQMQKYNHPPSLNVAWAMTMNDDDAAADSSNNRTDGGGGEQPEHMKQFFKDVEAIKSDILAVTFATEQITTLKDRAVLATSETEELQISDTIKTLVTDSNGRAKRCKKLLQLLKEENSNLQKEQKAKPTDLRVRENLVNTLLRKLFIEMKRYQNSQHQYKIDVKKKVTRQVQLIKPDATDQDIDEIMRSDGGHEALYQQQILSGGVNDQLKTQYGAVAEKYEVVLNLEASVAELHQMFQDFALLTEQQGELLDRVENQVQAATDYVEDANVDVYEAIEYQKKIRNKLCCLISYVMRKNQRWTILIAVVIILIITGILRGF